MKTIIILLFVLVVLVFIRMAYENRTLRLTEYGITSNRLPKEFHGCRFVMLSDLHNNEYGRCNQNLLNKIREQNPDYILIAGDMLVRHQHTKSGIALQFVQDLAKEFPVYYGNGNHELHLLLNEQSESEYKEYVRRLRQCGVHYLENETAYLTRNGVSIAVIGLNIGEEYYRRGSRLVLPKEYLDETVGKSNPSKYEILIAHNPMYFKTYAEWGADLVVSGHLHGGLVRLPFFGGVLSPHLVLFPDYDYGEYHEGGSTMILSGGLGAHTLKIRLFNKPEIVVITLSKS